MSSLMSTTIPTIPTIFKYQRNATFTSWLWSLWLCFPRSVRYGIYRLALRLFGSKPSFCAYVTKLPFGLYAKIGPEPDEALAMEFVRARTTIPVPVVLDHISGSWPEIRGSWLTLMTALPGTPLFEQGKGNRFATCTLKQSIDMSRVLSNWLDQMHAIDPPHPQRVCGFLGGPLFSHRIDLSRRVGPYTDPAEFHAQPFCTPYPDDADERLKHLINNRLTKQYRICLTHGDILPHNILADENFNLTGLIDWETAAWMPEYWERASSWRSHFCRFYGWDKIVPNVYPEYDDDMALEACIQLTWDP